MIVIDTDSTVRVPGPMGRPSARVRVFAACDRCRAKLGRVLNEDTQFDRGLAHASALSSGATEYLHGRVRRLACGPACVPAAAKAGAR